MATRFVGVLVLIKVDSLQVLRILCHPREFVGYNLPRNKVERLKGFKHEKVSPNINNDAGAEFLT